MLPYKKTLKTFSRDLRNNMTDAEQLLWARLRRKQILGVQFYRQKPIAGYIADFYCATAKLVVELDGSQHFLPEHKLQDEERDKLMAALGLLVLRFDNRQVLMETESVISIILAVVEKRI
jgi:very-short-patch-repair endonuclease